VIQSLADVRADGQIKLLAFVVMPDHYHAVLNPVRKGLAAVPEDWLFSNAHPSRSEMLDWDWWV
jgi:REP element-mobilizing transposase RayT